MRTGLIQCKDAILNTIGPSAKPFDSHLVKRVVRENEKKNTSETSNAELNIGRIKSRQQARREKKKEDAVKKLQDNILLGKMGRDATFLRDLLGPGTEIIPASLSAEQVPVGCKVTKECDSIFFTEESP